MARISDSPNIPKDANKFDLNGISLPDFSLTKLCYLLSRSQSKALRLQRRICSNKNLLRDLVQISNSLRRRQNVLTSLNLLNSRILYSQVFLGFSSSVNFSNKSFQLVANNYQEKLSDLVLELESWQYEESEKVLWILIQVDIPTDVSW